MKRILVIWLGCIALMGCTQNDGDIGKWFGTWQITCQEPFTDHAFNGIAATAAFVQFQGKVVRVCVTTDAHDPYLAIYGTWQADDGKMVWSFPDDDTWMTLVPGLQPENRFDILNDTGNAVEIGHTAADGVYYTYKLQKVI